MKAEPEPGETMYRHVESGELGFHKEGSDRIRVVFDDGRQLYRTYMPQQWVDQDDKRMRPVNKAQVAQVCFAADRELCKVIGLGEIARAPGWDLMRDTDRARWIDKGPRGTDIRRFRRKLYLAMRVVLDELEGET